MVENLIVIGGGLHAGVCIDIIEKTKRYKIVGIIDSIAKVGSSLFGYKVIGRQEELFSLCKKHKVDAGVVAIGDNFSRKLVRDIIVSILPEFKFVNIIHPNVTLGRKTELGIGIVIMSGVIIGPECIIEDFCILNTGAQLEHNSFMGEYSHLSAGSITGGKVRIGKFSAITLGVILVDRITIGENTVVGSGSLVLCDLPDNVLAYGNPAKIIRTREAGERFLK